MSLVSVLQTAYSGLSAAAVSVDAVSQNVANARSNNYRAIRPVQVTQPPGRQGLAIQLGAGVRVASLAVDRSPGSFLIGTEHDEIRFEDQAWDSELPSAIEDLLIEEGVIQLLNTDIGEELVESILASNEFLANASVFETADELLGELVYLDRPR